MEKKGNGQEKKGMVKGNMRKDKQWSTKHYIAIYRKLKIEQH
jgi:hypothetical protein